MTRSFGLMVAGVLLAGAASASAAPLTVLSEGFDDFDSMVAAGWVSSNNSTPGGSKDYWFRGDAAVFTAQSGADDSYIAATLNAAAPGGDVSLWLLTPELEFGSGTSVVEFWTRVDNAERGDVLQFRLSTSGGSIDVGASPTSTGVFSSGVTSQLGESWTLNTATINNPGSAVSGRLALRYMVTNTAQNGSYIGIDTFSYRSASVPVPVPEPATLALLGLGLLGVAAGRRRA